jgi:anhydro-N-acetylmuramic acid kinase
MLIDALVSHFTCGRQHYDKNAAIAQTGRSIPALLDELLRDPYLKLASPKSTGREYYGRTFVQKVLALGRHHRAKPADLVRAATIFTALSIVDALHRFVLPKTKIDQLIVSGGGANNPLILAQLTAALSGHSRSARPSLHVGARFSASPPHSLVGAQHAAPHLGKTVTSGKIEVFPSSHLGIPEDAKEAFAFALLAYETFHHRPGNLPSATGARGPAILGKISYAPPR